MKKIKEVTNKSSKKSNLVIILLFIIALLFMSVGFARYNQTINWGGTVVVKPDGIVKIIEVKTVSLTHAKANPVITDDKKNVDFNLSFTTVKPQNNQDTPEYKAKFSITIENDSSYDYIYIEPDYSPTVTNGSSTYNNHIDVNIEGISTGNKIPSKQKKTFTVTITFYNPEEDTGTYTINGEFSPSMKEDTSASLICNLTGTKEGNLRGDNNLAEFTVEVINSYNVSKTFMIELQSEKYVVKNQQNNGSAQYTISANNPGETFKFKVAKIEGTEHLVDRDRVKATFTTTDGLSGNLGMITLLVDKTETEIEDTEPPTISNVSARINNKEGSATITWDGSDESNVSQYTIIAYNNGVEEKRGTTESDETEYTFSSDLNTELSAGTYYFVVYGTDTQNNTASANDIENATTSPGYASKSEEMPFKWRFSVTNTSDQYVSFTGEDHALLGSTYTCTVRAANSSDYNQPSRNSIEVTMGGEDAPFEYDSSTGTITILDVQNDLTIYAEVTEKTNTCLTEGTKILLANGTYKNIENIRYTDLLKVYDHVNGKLTEVYPIWIEKGNKANHYKKITFSDGSNLKIVNNHSLFDVDKKRYIEASNSNELKVGTRIYGISKNNKLKILTVTKLDNIKETVNYYNIVSTIHYNIIANNIITTDPTSSISNIYRFKDKAIYSENYNKISSKSRLRDAGIKQLIPNYLYCGLNLKNAYSLVDNHQLNISFLQSFINRNTLELEQMNGKRAFIVTTSYDNLNVSNTEKYLYQENSDYILPKNCARYFVETSTNKLYRAGERVKVSYSMHFRAVE